MATRLTKKRKGRLVWKEGDIVLLKKRFIEAKSPVQKSVETLRDEFQKLFPESNVVLK